MLNGWTGGRIEGNEATSAASGFSFLLLSPGVVAAGGILMSPPRTAGELALALLAMVLFNHEELWKGMSGTFGLAVKKLRPLCQTEP